VGLPHETAAKKKVVAVRSARNSANLTASTLQEDLMRLIGPDREEAASEQGSHQDSPLSRLPRKTLSELSLMKSRSRENIAGSALGGGGGSELAGEENLSFHMARPATVISSSSLASSANSPSTAAATSVGSGGREDEVQMLLLQQQRGASPHVSSVSIGVVNNSSSGAARSGRNSSSSGGQSSPVVVLATAATAATASRANKEPGGGGNSNTVTPDKDMDWNSLVDTATKAILSGSEEASAEGGGGAQRRPRSALLEGEEVRRLLERVSSLEVELAGERAGREQLGRQVDQLREENVRLQEESQTAAQQLRRFTEWFFQTIDKS
jgi:signal-induced proliferation-associated 1 like protein 1